ncbi:unnamed protein product [Adineta steineri]|uniref:Uncharacterized protein n=1 Tax=Adineta steineri TaxID=433720 RepID=A0A816AN41_9BILA|nr:unnamed protein product [Adineta steineri]CAF1599698.1 unnamed protein product [Adineta steineri]
MKAIKTNSGTNGVVSNMVPSLQHVYTVSFLLGKVEYVARQNVYDKSKKKKSSKCHILFLHKACLYFLKDVYNPDVEEKWNRLRPTSKRQYHYLSSKIEIELEEPESDASYEHSKSAHYYMFNRVYQQWEEATETEQQEHEGIISFKNSAKIPRFICNFARFRLIMNILWHDDVYQFIEISETVEPPYRVSDSFIEAVKNVMDQMFPSNLRKDDGTKILVIEKDTALMGDLFFGHVDYVSRQLFDLSSIQEKFNTSPIPCRVLKRGTRSSYSMATPNQIKRSNLAHTALIKLNLNINEYEKLWKQCLLPTPELAGKIDKPAIDYISSQLVDYISIIHRLGNADDPVAQEILKPGLHSAQIGIDFNSNTFSLASEHILNFNTDDDVMKQLKKICIRPTNGKNDLLICTKSSMVDNHHYINTTDTLIMDLSQPDVMDISLLHVDVVEQLQTKLPPSSISKNMSSNETYEISILKSHGLFNEKAFSSIEYDYPISDSLNINNSDESFHNQQHPYQKLSCKLSSSIIVGNNDDNGYKTTSTSAMDVDSNSQVSSDNETMPSAYTTTSDDSNKTSNETNIQPSKTFDIITLSKRLMLKPFIAFTKTDATRIYNNAETKNIVIGYLQQHGLIKQIDDLFLSSIPRRKITKYEIGYVKLFPNSQSASNTASFEVKLREKVGITFDDYVGKVLNGENASTPASIINNMFNTVHNKWLLNREWYDKIKAGYFSEYYQNKIICPDTNMSLPMVNVASVSSDDVRDLLDRPRSTMTASQRTNKELRRLGAKRQQAPGDEPSPKRKRKPKRFADDN